MNAPQALHPADQTLHAYGLGKLDDSSAESIGKHLESCSACRSRVAELSPDSFLGRLRDAQGRPESPGPVVSSVTGQSGQPGRRRPPAPAATGTLPPGMANHPDYEILRELGRGGMGVVYLAQNKLMGRHEVLKVVGGHLAKRSGVLDRFLVEIRNAAKLHHPNIVTAYSALRFGEDLVLAMEYVEGFDLSRVVKAQGPLAVASACSYMHQAALGLEHAHEHGMVHRDIKPSNLMLARLGNRAVVKILDFGLAKVQREQSPAGTLTQPGQLLGTPAYMAPEQTSDPRQADIRADVYSLGCTLYYLLTGNPPFQGANLYDMLQAHQSMEALPLNLARPDVPVQLAVIVATMMTKEPERRFQTPKEVAQALAPFAKKENSRSQGVMPELSWAEAASRPQPSPPADPPSAAVPPAPIHPGVKPAEPAPAGSQWDTLVEVKQEDLSEEVRAIREARASRPWLWPAAACVLVMLGLAVYLGMSLEARKNNNGGASQRAPQTGSLEKVVQPALATQPSGPSVAPYEHPSPTTTKPKGPDNKLHADPETKVAENEDSGRSGRDDKAPPAEKGSSEKEPPKAATFAQDSTGADDTLKPVAESTPKAGSPEALLASRGLKQAVQSKRIYYVGATELEFARALPPVRAAINQLKVAYNDLDVALWWEDRVRVIDYYITTLQFDIRDLNTQIANTPNDAPGRIFKQQVAQVRQGKQLELGDWNREIVMARKHLVSSARMARLMDEYKTRRADFLQAARELQPVYEKLRAECNAMKQDEEVKVALRAIGEARKVKVSLGPSADVNAAVNTLRAIQELVTDDPDAFRVKKRKTKLKEGPNAKAPKAG